MTAEMTSETTGETRENRIKRLIYRSIYTGTKETDLLLGNFAKRNLDGFNDQLLDEYEALIENSDPDLYMWISRRKPVPDAWNGEIMQRLQDFKLED
jgi:antitoxin CptB